MLVRSLICAMIVGSGLIVGEAVAAAGALPSYDVICVERTLPVDPEPYRACVPYPL